MTETPNTMRAVVMREPGGPDVLHLAEIETPVVRPQDVLVKVTAAGVNGPDLVQRRGHYPPPEGASPHLGLEVSGEVIALGSDTLPWRLGDRVVALTNGGGYAEYVAVDAAHCLRVPTDVPEVDAAGLPETFFTVWSNVFHGHKMPENGVFLVHGGAGGIGSTAIQLGRAFGLKILTTVGDDEAAAFATKLGADKTINFRAEDFVSITRDVGGADIILDIIGGEYIARNIKAARHDARIIQLAFNAGSKVEVNLMPIMLKRIIYTGSTLRSRPDGFKADVAEALAKHVWPRFASGELSAVTHTVLPFERAGEAHEMLEASKHMGKVLLTP
ncbi:MAG: NAD(P)H-quinone oxidoreductase [Pseudomonadota bacterium]